MASSRIEGKSFTSKELFEDSTYSIDYYQREYAWSEKDVRTLVEDLREEFNSWFTSRTQRRSRRGDPPTYFMGPFVYYDARQRERFLVDGRQRFTTIPSHLHPPPLSTPKPVQTATRRDARPRHTIIQQKWKHQIQD